GPAGPAPRDEWPARSGIDPDPLEAVARASVEFVPLVCGKGEGPALAGVPAGVGDGRWPAQGTAGTLSPVCRERGAGGLGRATVGGISGAAGLGQPGVCGTIDEATSEPGGGPATAGSSGGAAEFLGRGESH